MPFGDGRPCFDRRGPVQYVRPCHSSLGLESFVLRAVMQIFAEFDSHEALVREFQNNLAKARAFVVGSYEVTERERVEFVLIHPVTGEWLPLQAEVVYIAPSDQAAVGLEILEWTAERTALIQSFVDSTSVEVISLVSPASIERERFELTAATPHVTGALSPEPELSPGISLSSLNLSHHPGIRDADEPADEDPFVEEPAFYGEAEPGLPLEEDLNRGTAAFAPEVTELSIDEDAAVNEEERDESEEREPNDWVDDDSAPHSESNPPSSRLSQPPPKNVQERVRKLNMREREAMARGGTLTERVALERAYGAVVWDGLLANAALTGPEVARIAKNGNATVPHLTLIVSNPTWLAKSEVRRALLTNPRLTPPQIERVLRALPPAELKQLPKQTAYAPKVRAVAMKMLSR